jgi:hypothetical protein
MKIRNTNYKGENKYFVKEYDSQTKVYDSSVREQNKTINTVTHGGKVHTIKYHYNHGVQTSCGLHYAKNSTRNKYVDCQRCVNTFFNHNHITKYIKNYFLTYDYKVEVKS